MSLALLACCVSLTLLFGSFTSAVGRTSALRARAQVAADAAALAAVVENTIAGGGDPNALARSYAERNGARLLECRCDLGLSFVQLTVAIDGVEARARAEIDPAGLGPSVGSAGLHPRLAAAVAELLRATEGAVQVASGFRLPAHQERLWDAALVRYGDPEIADDWVARPGTSLHEQGLAVDLRGDLDLARRVVEEADLPLHAPLPHEPWHFELDGSRS